MLRDHFYVSYNPLTSIQLCFFTYCLASLNGLHYAALTALFCTNCIALHCIDFITSHFTPPQRVQVKVHITVPHVTEAPFSVGSVWSGQATLGIDRRGAIMFLLSLLYSHFCPCPTLPALSLLRLPCCSLSAFISIFFVSSRLLLLF